MTLKPEELQALRDLAVRTPIAGRYLTPLEGLYELKEANGGRTIRCEVNAKGRAVLSAATTLRVVDRWKRAAVREAMEFPTEDALRTYLKDHPRAKARNHTVKKPKHDDAAKPADKKEVGQASKAIAGIGKTLDQLFEHGDSDAGQQLPRVMSEFHDAVTSLTKGINSIPAGKDRDRAKKIDGQLDDIIEGLNKELGYRWKRPGKSYMTPSKAESAYRKMQPLLKELDQLLEGQRTLLAGTVPFLG